MPTGQDPFTVTISRIWLDYIYIDPVLALGADAGLMCLSSFEIFSQLYVYSTISYAYICTVTVGVSFVYVCFIRIFIGTHLLLNIIIMPIIFISIYHIYRYWQFSLLDCSRNM